MALFELGSASSSVYCHWTPAAHLQGECLCFDVDVYSSSAGTSAQGGFWSLTDGDVAFLLHSVIRPRLSNFFLPASVPPPPSPLLLFEPLCFICRFLLHSAIQSMSGADAVRIKATGSSRFMMNPRCLTEAASNIHRERERGGKTNLSTASDLCETFAG